MRGKVRFAGLGLLLVVVLALGGVAAGCAKKPSLEQSNVKIGWIGALSGTNAVLGKWDTHGVLLAFDEYNAKGGLKGRKLELIKYDDEADPSKAVNAAKRLVTEDKVVAAVACTNSTCTLAVVPVFQQAKVPHVTGSLSLEITQKGSYYVFRDTPAGPAFESGLIDYLVKKGYKKFAIITDTTAYGKGEADYQEMALAKHGLTVLTRQAYNPEDKDFSGQLTAILKTNPEVLLFGGSEVASGLIAKQARKMGFNGQMAGGVALATPKFIEVATPELAEGVIVTSNYIEPVTDLQKEVAKRYLDKWGYEMEPHGAKAYDGAMLLITALEKAYPNITGEEIAKQLHSIKGFKGVQGEFNVIENGETISQVHVGIIKGGKVVPVSGD